MTLIDSKKRVFIILAVAVLLIYTFQFIQLAFADKYKDFSKQNNLKRVFHCVDEGEEGGNFYIFQFLPRIVFAFRWVREWNSESFDMLSYSKTSEVDNSSPFPFASPDFNAVMVVYDDMKASDIIEMHAGYLMEADAYFSFFEDRNLVDGDLLHDMRAQLGGALSIHRFDGRVFAGIRTEDRVFSEFYKCSEIDDPAASIVQFSTAIEAHDSTQAERFEALNRRLEEERSF